MSIAALLRKHGQSVTVRTKAASGTDSSGSITEAWTGGDTTYKAFVDVQSSSDSVTGGAERSQRVAKVYFEGTPTVAVKDRLLYDSIDWEITSIINPGEFSATSHLSHTIVEAVEVFE